MLDNNKIQYIGKIENSNNVVIINGNLTIDGQISKDPRPRASKSYGRTLINTLPQP